MGKEEMTIRKLLCTAAILTLMASARGQDNGLKIYISADMEGIVGVVTDAQLSPDGFEYERFREFMTAEVNAAIDAARAAGATEFVISDSHGNGQNLLIDRLPDDVTVIRSWPRELSMMAGIDDTFDAAMLVAYHAKAGTLRGIMAHTYTGKVFSLKFNDIEVGEIGADAAIAGYFGIPVVMVTGDGAACDEARALLGDIETVAVKEGVSRSAGRPNSSWYMALSSSTPGKFVALCQPGKMVT